MTANKCLLWLHSYFNAVMFLPLEQFHRRLFSSSPRIVQSVEAALTSQYPACLLQNDFIKP